MTNLHEVFFLSASFDSSLEIMQHTILIPWTPDQIFILTNKKMTDIWQIPQKYIDQFKDYFAKNLQDCNGNWVVLPESLNKK